MPIVLFFQRLTCLFLFTGRSYKQIVTYGRPMDPHYGGLVFLGGVCIGYSTPPELLILTVYKTRVKYELSKWPHPPPTIAQWIGWVPAKCSESHKSETFWELYHLHDQLIILSFISIH